MYLDIYCISHKRCCIVKYDYEKKGEKKAENESKIQA